MKDTPEMSKFIKAVSDTVILGMINAVRRDKPLIFIGATLLVPRHK